MWTGPQDQGITQSLLSVYLVCKERFRIRAIEELSSSEGFVSYIGYGHFWHKCEEARHMGINWLSALEKERRAMLKEYPHDTKQIEHWYQVCKLQYTVFVDYYEESDTPNFLTTEEQFYLGVTLPSGREVYLRGMFDGIFQKSDKTIWLKENKSKGVVDEERLRKQLQMDLQTMFYLTALYYHPDYGTPAGVLYDVIRRPLSGGKGTIRQKKTETKQEFYARLYNEYLAAAPEEYFLRLEVNVSTHDIDKFCANTLFPILENLYDDWEWWAYCKKNPLVHPCNYLHRQKKFPEHYNRHFVTPFGVYNILAEGGTTDYDHYLLTGQRTGLETGHSLFPELE